MHQKIFGKLPFGERLEKIQQSPQYKDGAFSNLSPTPVMAEDSSFWKTLKSYLNKPKDTTPSATIPSFKTNLHTLESDAPVIIWFGHSSYLLRINGFNILVDPVFSGNAAPVSFMVKAYPGSDIYTVADLPPIDILLLTHDHYDHLDYTTIMLLKAKVKMVVTALGVGSHFEYWGFDKNIITEFDWWDAHTVLPGLQLTAAPARHFSGRGIKRGKTLWTSFILKTATHHIYIGGDSGYDRHFKEIGDKYGTFDIAILESGQYNAHWPHIHMMPEDTVQASIDLKAKVLLPVHWGKFTLSLHPWNEPPRRIVRKATELQMGITTPMIGEPVVLDRHYPTTHWWEF
jgi:L-ascorbate metabolism protein UlaG (beta-lactamase superfamily)